MPDQERFPEPPSDDDIRRRFSELRDQLNADPEVSELSDEVVDAKREEIQSSLRSANELPPVPEWNPPRNPFAEQRAEEKKTHEAYSGLGAGLTAAYAMIGFPAVGLGVGYLIDKALGSSPNGIGLGCCLGLTVALWFVIRVVNRLERK